MKLIFNSDVLFHSNRVVRDELSSQVTRLLKVCAARGIEVVVPRVVRLEFERHQAVEVERSRQRLRAAYELLAEYGVDHAGEDPELIVKQPVLLRLMGDSGASVRESDATIDEYRDAERRAALRHTPHPPDIKSDEMRDLVIWAQALGEARSGGGAILISRDTVHVGHRGDLEAEQHGLVRVTSVELALEYLEVLTPTGALIASLLEPAWAAIAERQTKLPTSLDLRGVSRASFVQGKAGVQSARGQLRIGCGEGQEAEAGVLIQVANGKVKRVELSDVKIGKEAFKTVVVDGEWHVWDPAEDDQHAEQLEKLRKVLGQ